MLEAVLCVLIQSSLCAEGTLQARFRGTIEGTSGDLKRDAAAAAADFHPETCCFLRIGPSLALLDLGRSIIFAAAAVARIPSKCKHEEQMEASTNKTWPENTDTVLKANFQPVYS